MDADEPLHHGRNRWRDPGKPRRYRTDNTCKGKRYFADEIAARAGAAVSLEERANTTRLWVYRCMACPGWHITSKKHSERFLVTLEGRRR